MPFELLTLLLLRLPGLSEPFTFHTLELLPFQFIGDKDHPKHQKLKEAPTVIVYFLYKVQLARYTIINSHPALTRWIFLLACERVFTGFFHPVLSTSTCSIYFVWCFRCSISTSPKCTSFERNGGANTGRIAHIGVVKVAREDRTKNVPNERSVAIPAHRRQRPPVGTSCNASSCTI